jgi:hypothetical protein
MRGKIPLSPPGLLCEIPHSSGSAKPSAMDWPPLAFPFGWSSTSSPFPSRPRHIVGGIRAIDERQTRHSEMSRFLPDADESQSLIQTPLRAHGGAVNERNPPTRMRLAFEEEQLPDDVRQHIYEYPSPQRDRTSNGHAAPRVGPARSSRESFFTSDLELSGTSVDEAVGQKRVAPAVATTPRVQRPFRSGASVFERLVAGTRT